MVEKSQYKTILEWAKANPKDYEVVKKRKWVDRLCEVFGWENITRGHYWTKERCMSEAKKYKFRNEWCVNSGSSYSKARKKGWFDECIKHMELVNKPNGYWTKEKCLNEAKKYKTKVDWKKNNTASYMAAHKKGWYHEIIKICGIVDIRKSTGYWTKEKCLNEAKKYKTLGEWYRNSTSSYNKANKNNWHKECAAHMIRVKKPSGYWTKEKCIEEARKYKTKADWERGSGASHVAARTNGWYDECVKHMISTKKPNGYWTKERCIEDAKKYKTRVDWGKNSGSAINTARRKGWMDECAQHMVRSYKRRNG